MMKLCWILSIFFFSAQASVERAEYYYQKKALRYYPQVAKELVDEGIYFGAVPFVKEYLGATSSAKQIDDLVDELITYVGVRQFESLAVEILSKSNAPMIKYILAKKYFRLGRYEQALMQLRGVTPSSHPAYPFAQMLEASIYSITGKYEQAITKYKSCVNLSNSLMSSLADNNRIRQLEINRDSCIVGIPRTQYAQGKFEAASDGYMELPKSSHIWPEILFEEAWNSFFMRDYNRTLGKLVTYKSPFINYVFNPEIDVLKALTYLELCLYEDAKTVVDDFYQQYQNSARGLGQLLGSKGKDFKYFYLLAKQRRERNVGGSSLLNQLLKAITRDAVYIDMQSAFEASNVELAAVKQVRGGVFKKTLQKNLNEALLLQRNLIGAYVRSSLIGFNYQLERAFENMSYIKLETLSRRKGQLYSYETADGKASRSRGDIVNLKRTSKQYFWDFVGEFWADELGDYVFSLKSECK